ANRIRAEVPSGLVILWYNLGAMQVSHSVPKPAAETCIANPSPAAGGGFINLPTSADVFCAECGCYHTGGECPWCADKQTTAHIIKILRGE
ncbi:MAG: hypothetical protein ACR2PR_06390, partial [Pseudohongiellaceae bacterium]